MNWNKWKDKWVMFSFSIVIPIMIVFCVGFTIMSPMWVAHVEFDRIYDDVMDDIENADNVSDDFRNGWIAGVKHFRVLFYSGTNMTEAT